MKKTARRSAAILALALGACDGSASETLTDGHETGARDPNATTGGPGSTFEHANDPGAAAPGAVYQPPEPAQVRVVGAPEVTSRLHSCGKMTVGSLRALLESRGLTGGGPGRPNGSQGAPQMLQGGAATLGAANYPGRVPEAPFASTSAMAKMFDVFSMASYDAVAPNWSAPACPGVKLLEEGKFTKAGLTCLMGKPARDEHLALANDLVEKNPADGPKIAVAALLSAAHTCQ